MIDKSTVFVMEKDHPLPKPRHNKAGVSKYTFLRNMSVGDSFLVTEGMGGYKIKGFIAHLSKLRKDTGNIYTYRTVYGENSIPNKPTIRIWRLS